MTATTLVASAAVGVIAAGVYAYVGHRVSLRDVAPEAQTALHLFGVWWFALAGSALLSGTTNVLAAAGITEVTLHTVLTYTNLLVICLALWGLLYYLGYLFTGRRNWLVGLTLFYLVYFLALIYVVSFAQPSGVAVDRWSTGLVFEDPPTGWVGPILLALLVFPQILGALAYFSLFFRVEDPTERYRIAVVSWSIVLWFGSSFAASVSGLSSQDWWQLASRALGLAAAGAILMAYLPPSWLRERFGLRSLADETPSSSLRP